MARAPPLVNTPHGQRTATGMPASRVEDPRHRPGTEPRRRTAGPAGDTRGAHAARPGHAGHPDALVCFPRGTVTRWTCRPGRTRPARTITIRLRGSPVRRRPAVRSRYG